METIQDLVEILSQVLEVNDVEFSVISSSIKEQVMHGFHGAEAIQGAEAQVLMWRAEHKPVIEARLEVDSSIEGFKELIEGFKQGYSSSKEKIEFLDQLYESFAEYMNMAVNMYISDFAEIGVQKLHPNAQIPTYANAGDQGADLYAPEDVTIEPHTYGNLIKIGIALNIPEGWAVGIRPRSGMSKKTTLRLSNCYGTIDTNYKDEIGVLFDNIGDEPYTIHAGDRIAQMVLEKNYPAQFAEVADVKALGDDRGGGFGHSGN